MRGRWRRNVRASGHTHPGTRRRSALVPVCWGRRTARHHIEGQGLGDVRRLRQGHQRGKPRSCAIECSGSEKCSGSETRADHSLNAIFRCLRLAASPTRREVLPSFSVHGGAGALPCAIQAQPSAFLRPRSATMRIAPALISGESSWTYWPRSHGTRLSISAHAVAASSANTVPYVDPTRQGRSCP